MNALRKLPLDDADRDLIAASHREFEHETVHDWHGVSAAVRLASGEIATGLVLEAEVPALTVCAEPVVFGKILHRIKNDPVVCIVATRQREETDHKVIPPCGRCREFITDYGPESHLIVFDEEAGELCKVPCHDLLPFKYRVEPE